MNDTIGFSQWASWSDRGLLAGLAHPGVYALAIAEESLHRVAFDWIQRIAYFGMSNSIGGLKARLKQFDDSIRGRPGHGGGERFRNKHTDPKVLAAKLYVSIWPEPCDVNRKSVEDLLAMGRVAQREYACFARYVELHGALPEFNDMKRSPKRRRGTNKEPPSQHDS